jgi:hypothetical protein
VAAFENRQTVAAAKFLVKGSLFVQLLSNIGQPNSSPKANKLMDIYSSSVIMPNRLLYAVLFMVTNIRI